MNAHARRRAAVLERLGDGVMVLPAARHAVRNNDSEYEYRPDSDLYYLTGFTEPEAVLVLAPQHPDRRAVLFLRPRDRALETWTGRRLGVEAAPQTLGVDAAYPIGELAERLPELLAGATRVFARLNHDERFDRMLFAAVEAAKLKTRRAGIAPDAYVDPGTLVHELRLFKDADEIAAMRRAGAVTRLGHLAGMRATRPDMHEYELEALIEYTYRVNGAQDTAYSSIVAGGDNATILHYNTNRERLRDGDLVLVDSGAEVDCYAADVTRTWPVNGRFSGEQRALYEIVLAAQKAAIAQVRPGAHQRLAHDVALRVLTEGLLELGLLRGSLDDALASEAYKPFYMHGTGHWLGLDVHDVGVYKPDGEHYRELAAGMVVTVEPGLYVARDLDVDERFKGLGVRIEDDVLCGTDGPDVLSADIPKEIADLEGLVGIDAVVAS